MSMALVSYRGYMKQDCWSTEDCLSSAATRRTPGRLFWYRSFEYQTGPSFEDGAGGTALFGVIREREPSVMQFDGQNFTK